MSTPRILLLLVLAASLSAAQSGLGAAANFTGTYLQSFDGLGTAGTALPAGFRTMTAGSGASAYSATTPIPASALAAATASANQALTVWNAGSAVASSSTTLFNAGAFGNNNNRALGTDPTSIGAMVIELSLTNNTGSDLTGVLFTYEAKCMTNGSAGTEQADLPGYSFFYSITGATLASAWTRVSALSLPNFSQGTSLSSGNVLITFPTPLTNNGVMYFRWADDNSSANSPDQMLAIDNVGIVSADAAKGGLYFDGVNDYVSFGPASSLGMSNFTVECWFMRTGSGVTGSSGSGGVSGYPLVTKGRGESDGSNVDCNWFFGFDTSGRLVADFEDYNSGLNHPVMGVSSLTSNSWQHAAVTYDVSSGRWVLYLNGVPDATNVIAGTALVRTPRFDSIQHAGLGTALNSSGVPSGFFSGRMDEVRIWNYARSAAEIASNYQQQILHAPGLAGRWSLDETNGNTIFGNGAAHVIGTLLNGPLFVPGNGSLSDPQDAAPAIPLVLSPLNNSTGVLDGVALGVQVADQDGDPLNVLFYGRRITPPGGWVVLGTNALTTNASASVIWNGLATNSTYEWYAVADDTFLSATSSVASFMTAGYFPPGPPVVTLTSPIAGATYVQSGPLTLSADAISPGGAITNVSFFVDGNKIGQVTSAPFRLTWMAPTTGTHTFAAVAADELGATNALSAISATISAPAATTITRGPYLQLSTPNSIVIRWRTAAPTDSTVAYGSAVNSLTLTNHDPLAVTNHEVTLSNLSPDSLCYYLVGSTAGANAGPGSAFYFYTHPLPGDSKPLRVWVIGDAGTGTANQAAVRDAFYSFNGTNRVHAWLQLGDNAYSSGLDSEYQANLFNVYTSLLRNTVTWPTLGNHETDQSTVYSDNYAHFQVFTLPTAGEAGGVPSGTEHYYSFDLGMVHFVCLDSMTASRATNGAMANWLRADLAQNTNRWLIAYWHHPPYTKGSHNSDTESQLIEMRANFNPILEAGGVDLVLSGHSHSYERSYLINSNYGLSGTFSSANIVQPGGGRDTNGVGAYIKPLNIGSVPAGNKGTVYSVVGSSGQTSGGTLNHPAMFMSLNNLGSMVLDITPTTLNAIFLRETGATNDWFTIRKPGSSEPTPLAYEVTGNNLQLSWPPDHVGWRLQAQTNDPGSGISSGWNTVPGSTNNTQLTWPVNAANGSVFFRLVYP